MIGDKPQEEVPLLHLQSMMHRLIRLTDSHRQYGLTKSQVLLLTALYYRETVTMGEIAQYISSSKEQATRAVASLCDQGIVERFEHPENRTKVHIRFTERGRELMRRFGQQLRQEMNARLEASLSPEELETLRCSVQTTMDILSKVK